MVFLKNVTKLITSAVKLNIIMRNTRTQDLFHYLQWIALRTHIFFRDKTFTVPHPPNLAGSLNLLAAFLVTKTKGVDYFSGPCH